MIVSPGRGMVFVHPPKTGGTAVMLAYEARARADDILIGDTPKAQRRRHRLRGFQTAGRLWKHARLADIEGLIPREAFAGMLVCATVRNPWDRVVSYYHWLRAQGFDHPAVRLAARHEFSGFLNHPDTAAALLANPYAAYATDGAGTMRGGFWLHQERLAGDVAELGRRLGLRLALPEGVNRSQRVADWRAYYSDADAALVARLCADDIARFGYGFDDFASGT